MEFFGDQQKTTIAVKENIDVGSRLDLFLVKYFPEYSRSFFQKCLDEQRVLVNGRFPKRSAAVMLDDQIDIFWPPPPITQLLPEPIPLAILHEDDDIIVLNKPAGLVVHPACGNMTGTLVQGLLNHLGDDFASMIDEEMRPGIVHRLDKNTSGIMVVAKHLQAKDHLKQAFKQYAVHKSYLAIVMGKFPAETTHLETLIGRHSVNRQRRAVVKNNGKNAITHFKVLGYGNDCTLLEVEIITGRTHQIRVHCAHLRHPVLGDALYGGKRGRHANLAERQMLHAWKLSFPHPNKTGISQCQAEPPEDFQKLMTELALTVTPEAGQMSMRNQNDRLLANWDKAEVSTTPPQNVQENASVNKPGRIFLPGGVILDLSSRFVHSDFPAGQGGDFAECPSATGHDGDDDDDDFQ